ncbi:MAG: sugar ABC transporter permease [Chloroflexi bacterium]|nr:sugar ABC transporter permease [Chloroflexota bacterium]MCC6896858.1 sugar ABC transporter permease [Anaerolineae bacterium]
MASHTMTSVSEAKKAKQTTWQRQRSRTGFLFVLPTVLFVSVFFLIPLLMTAFMSLHDWPLFGERTFIGIQNYLDLFGDRQFIRSLDFTARYTLVITPLIFIVAFILASLVNRRIPFIGFFRTIFFLPVVIGLGISSLLWVWLLNDQVGIINKILLDVGFIEKPQLWLAKPDVAMNVVIVSVIWKTVGFTMVLLLAGMQAIPGELYESAEVDGAGYWQKMRYITLPLLRRTIALALVLSVIGSILSFDQFFIITGGGPRNSTISVVYWIFNNSFTYFKMGYGAAMSIVLMIVLVLLSAVQLFVLRENTDS